jgi:Spy/CpxP family protein refolding chaperone
MRNLMSGMALGCLAMILVWGTSAVRAQDDPPTGDDGGQPAMRHKGDWGGKDHMADRWKEKLGLSDSQVTQLKDAFKKQMEEAKSLRDQERIDRDTLQQKVDLKTSDSEIQKLLDTLSADREKAEAKRKKFEEQLKSILSPTQRAKFVLDMGRGMNRWKGRNWDRDGKGHDWKGGKGKPKGSSNAADGDQGSDKGN